MTSKNYLRFLYQIDDKISTKKLIIYYNTLIYKILTCHDIVQAHRNHEANIGCSPPLKEMTNLRIGPKRMKLGQEEGRGVRGQELRKTVIGSGRKQ
jgi:hypothetical protein